jgi:hypothetical protein
MEMGTEMRRTGGDIDGDLGRERLGVSTRGRIEARSLRMKANKREMIPTRRQGEIT